MSRVALFALLAVACKKEAELSPPPGPPPPGFSAPTAPEPTPRTATPPSITANAPPEPTMSTPPPAPSGWAQRSGPGFTVDAPSDATKTRFDGSDRDPAADVYTFHRTDRERYEVRVITASGTLSRAIATLRDRISFSATQVRNEEYLPEGLGEARGVDIAYIVSEDFSSQYARTRLIGAKGHVYQVRALFPEDRDADAAKFVESFALAK